PCLLTQSSQIWTPCLVRPPSLALRPVAASASPMTMSEPVLAAPPPPPPVPPPHAIAAIAVIPSTPQRPLVRPMRLLLIKVHYDPRANDLSAWGRGVPGPVA